MEEINGFGKITSPVNIIVQRHSSADEAWFSVQKMKRILLHRATIVNGYRQFGNIREQFGEGGFQCSAEHEAYTAFGLVFAEEDHRSAEVRIFQKRLCNEHITGAKCFHRSNISKSSDISNGVVQRRVEISVILRVVNDLNCKPSLRKSQMRTIQACNAVILPVR